MITGLNRLTEFGLQQLLQRNEAWLADARNKQQANPQVLQRPQFHMSLAEIYLDLLRSRYALGEAPAGLRLLLAEAAQHYLRMFQLRNLKGEAELRARGERLDISIFRPQRMYLGVAATLIANLQPLLEQFAAIPSEAYSNRYPPEYDIYHGCIGVLLEYALGQKSSARSKAREFVAREDSPAAKSPKVLRNKLVPLVRGVIAVLEAKPEEVTSALKTILDIHAKDAKRGESAEELWTLLSLDALVLASIAKRESMQVTLANRYMPVELINEQIQEA